MSASACPTLPAASPGLPGPWVIFRWKTVSLGVLQARRRVDGDVDVRRLWPDEFGRLRWESAERCPASYWYNEACTCRVRQTGDP